MTDRNTTIYPDKKELCIEDMVKGIGRKATDEELLDYLLKAFPNKIINLHPALLPKYGGAGMYGDHVHKAILANNEEESGITIHFVDEQFDEGEIIHQSRFKIEPGDNLEMIKFKGQQLEHQHFPRVVENLLKKMKS